MQKVRSITIEMPARSCNTLERLAATDHVTLQSFVQQRLAEFLTWVTNAQQVQQEVEPQSGLYL